MLKYLVKGSFYMFRFKKQMKKLEELKQELIKEKNELSFIKNELNKLQPAIDITNVYIWYDPYIGTYNIVRYDIRNTIVKDIGYISYKLTEGYESTLIDIFNNNILYHKLSVSKIKYNEFVSNDKNHKPHEAYLIPLHKFDKNILAYVDNKVPLYVLQQLYYRLNKVDVKTYALKKEC